jgi:hypothetical protein
MPKSSVKTSRRCRFQSLPQFLEVKQKLIDNNVGVAFFILLQGFVEELKPFRVVKGGGGDDPKRPSARRSFLHELDASVHRLISGSRTA